MTPRFHIDAPLPKTSKTAYSPVCVSGWFVDEHLRGAVTIRVHLGGHTVLCERVDRPDAAAHVSTTPLSRNDIGFLAHVPTAARSARLVIEAETVSGRIIVLRRQSLRLKQWSPRPAGLLARVAAWRRCRVWANNPPTPADSVLVLIPVKPGTDPAVIAHARMLAERALKLLPSASRIVFDDRGTAITRKEHAWRIAALAAIRQNMVDRHLRDERWVFWADLDLSDYPADLIAQLIRRAGGGIAAPMVFMENAASPHGGSLFYDIAGFVEKGRWALPYPPYFHQPGPVYDLDSVGACYLIPTYLYRKGARHEEDPGSRRWIESRGVTPQDTTLRDWQDQAYTDHYSVCAFARQHGLPVRAHADLIAMHEHVG